MKSWTNVPEVPPRFLRGFLQFSSLLPCLASVFISVQAGTGEEVFYAAALFSPGLCSRTSAPTPLSPGPLCDTLYLLNFTSLALSTVTHQPLSPLLFLPFSLYHR